MKTNEPINAKPEAKLPSTAEEPPWWQNWKIMLPIWVVIVVFVVIGLHFKIDTKLITGTVFLIGLLSNAFAWLLGIIALVPIVPGRSADRPRPVLWPYLVAQRDQLLGGTRCHKTRIR